MVIHKLAVLFEQPVIPGTTCRLQFMNDQRVEEVEFAVFAILILTAAVERFVLRVLVKRSGVPFQEGRQANRKKALIVIGKSVR